MSRALKTTFLIYAVVTVLVGVLLLVIPGRFLWWVGWGTWETIDPLMSKLAGAALLALSWGSFYGWRAAERSQVAILIEMEAAFTALACVGWLRNLLVTPYPARVWVVFAVLAVFAIAWIVFLVKK